MVTGTFKLSMTNVQTRMHEGEIDIDAELVQRLLIIPYYPETNPEFVNMAKRTVAEILTDLR